MKLKVDQGECFLGEGLPGEVELHDGLLCQAEQQHVSRRGHEVPRSSKVLNLFSCLCVVMTMMMTVIMMVTMTVMTTMMMTTVTITSKRMAG